MPAKPPITSAELSELLALAGVAPAPSDSATGQPGGFLAMFQAWAAEHELRPGPVKGIEGLDLARHFSEWCASHGTAPIARQTVFGRALRALGLRKGRGRDRGRDYRPYMLARSTATYFRGWLEANPPTSRACSGINGPRKE